MDFLKNKIFATVIITLFVTLIFGGISSWNPLELIHLKLNNFLYTRNEPSPDITIIGIDEKSLDPKDGLGRFSDWPRTYYADLLKKFLNSNQK